jgi:hypothetical protein
MAFDPFAPLRLSFRIGLGVLRFELRLVEHMLGLDRQQPDVVVPKPERFEPEPAAPQRRPPQPERPEPAPPVVVIPEPEPAPEPEPEAPTHIDTEPELVAEVAEAGAEEGAGAEVRVAEPWDGYKRMRVADIRDRVAVAEMAELAVVQLYESSHRNRRSILDAVERRSKELANAPSSRR